MSGAFLSIVKTRHHIKYSDKASIFCKKTKSAYACFLRKKKWLYRPIWDCNALSGLTYTGNVCILAYFIFSKMLNAFEIL